MFAVTIVGGGLEEVGWRGYLLPRMQERRSALAASLIVGVVWTFWHLPLLLMEGTSQASFALGWYALHTIALAVLFTWAYNASGGSTLLAVLAHAAVNTGYTAEVEGLAPETLDAFMPYAALLLTVAAGIVVWRHGPRDLAHRPRDVWSPDLASSASTGHRPSRPRPAALCAPPTSGEARTHPEPTRPNVPPRPRRVRSMPEWAVFERCRATWLSVVNAPVRAGKVRRPGRVS